MAVDWNLLQNVDIEDLDDERAEDIYDLLLSINPESISETAQLRKLFNISKMIMEVKAVQTSVALEELEELTKQRDNRRELDNLRVENRAFKELLDAQEDEDGSGSISEKIKSLSSQLIDFKKEVDGKDKELRRLNKRLTETNQVREELERNSDALKKEIAVLREDVNHGSNFDEGLFEEKESFMDKIREKNHQIQKLLDEMKELEDENKDLDSKVKELKLKLSDATNHVTQSTHDMTLLHNRVKEVQAMSMQLISEKEFLVKENHDLVDKIHEIQAEDDSMAKQFSDQVDKVIEIMKEKDIEIDRLTESLKKYTRDKSCPDEDTLIMNDLRNQLKEATATIQYQTSMIDQLQRQSLKKEDKTRTVKKTTDDLDPDNVLFQRLEQLESELQEKDDKIVSLSLKNKSYEEGHYGLPDALIELDILRNSLKRKEEMIESMNQQLNDLHSELNDSQDELEYVKECANLSNITDFNSLDSTGKSTKQDRLKLLKLQQQLIRMEEQKIDLQQEIRSLHDKVTLLKSSESNDSLMKQVARLELENQDLRLGMKEILIGIKESDSKSDVTIDCPTLERLCSFLEATSISTDHSIVVALKAELDVTRGFNEELRKQLKNIRCQHLNVLSLYTQDVLKETAYDDFSDHDDNDDDDDAFVFSEDVTLSAGQVLPTRPDRRVISYPINNDTIQDNHDDIHVHREDVLPSAPPLPIPEIIVEEVGSFSRRDSSTQTEVAAATKRSSWKTPLSPPPKDPKTPVMAVTSLTVKKCCRCSKLTRTLNDIKTLLAKSESSIRKSDTVFQDKIDQLQADHSKVITAFQSQIRQMDQALQTKDSVIQALKSAATATITSRKSSSISRRDTFVVSTEDITTAQQQSQAVMMTFPALTDFDHQEETRKPDHDKEKYAEIIENIMKSLQGRIDSKNQTIRDFEKLLEDSKKIHEQQVKDLEDNFRREKDKSSDLIMKMLQDNEALQESLQKCQNDYNDFKIETNKSTSFLEKEVEDAREKVSRLEQENEDLRKRSSSHSTVVVLRNEVNHLKDEIKSREATITSLNKSLKEERLLRVTSKVTDTKPSSKSQNEVLLESQLKSLRQEVEETKKLLRDHELKKWETEKRIKEVNETLKTQVKQQSKEIRRLKDFIDRQRNLLQKNSLPGHQLLKEEEIKDHVSSVKKKTVSFESVSFEEPPVKHQAVQVDSIRRRSSLVSQSEKDARLEEVKILLEESLQREKLAALRLTSSQFPEMTVDEILLQENASLKVELRMALFQLHKAQHT